MALTNLLQHVEEEIAGTGRIEKRTALVVTDGDEVAVPSAVEAVQICRHENDVTRTRQLLHGGHPVYW